MKLAALAGGVGAAKFLSGLVEVFPPEDLTVIVNTGDDFRWHGLYVCPDADTILYTLAGIANPWTGWGVIEDTFHALDRLGVLGTDTWFKIGDRDLATHIYRTCRLQSGHSLTAVTEDLCRRNGVKVRVLPMTDSPVPTMVDTEEGWLGFQDYFVRRHCAPKVRGFSFQGVADAAPTAAVLDAILQSDAVVLCPSNPYISIGPILAVPGIKTALKQTQAPVAAVTPIVAGAALKGPTADMMRQLGDDCTAAGVARIYREFLDHFVLDLCDERLTAEIEKMGIRVHVTDTIMDSPKSRSSLGRFVVELLS